MFLTVDLKILKIDVKSTRTITLSKEPTTTMKKMNLSYAVGQICRQIVNHQIVNYKILDIKTTWNNEVWCLVQRLDTNECKFVNSIHLIMP